jgi:hypothetical protein
MAVEKIGSHNKNFLLNNALGTQKRFKKSFLTCLVKNSKKEEIGAMGRES